MQKQQKKKQPEEFQYIPDYNDPDQFWSTFDLGCASALVTSGLELVFLNKENPRKVQFIFCNEPKLNDIVADFWADRLKLKARSYFENQKMIKNRIYSE